jgi:hypothetical protein
MPTNRQRRQRGHHLSLDQRCSLDVGSDGVYARAFASDADRRAAWAQWREYMLAMCRCGQRPSAWWEFESPVPRPADHHFDQAVLFAAGLLSARERKQLRDYWRAQYEEAYAEGFVHCLGPSQWLHGDAARDAHFRWYAIPSALIDEWDAERKEAAECRRTAS